MVVRYLHDDLYPCLTGALADAITNRCPPDSASKTGPRSKVSNV